jgi:histidinol dehydrogenase
MSFVAIRRWADLDAEAQARVHARSTAAIFEPSLVASIEGLFEEVRSRGDQGVIDATERFDRVRLRPDQLWIGEAEIDAAHASCSPALLDALRLAIANSRAFNEAQVAHAAIPWRTEIRPGHLVGETFQPIPSAGLFVPSGKATYPSVLAQIGTPAVVAGVRELIVAVPPAPGTRDADPATLTVARELGISRVLRVNGPAGIAAMTFGTESVPRVHKIVGPGSPAVTISQVLAQRHGVATQMLCGPSESLLIADATADPERSAMDLINEAEHGADSAATLVTDSADLADAVAAAAERQIKLLPTVRADAVRAVLGGIGGILLFETLDEAIEFASEYAAEHVQIATRDPEAVAAELRYAGEVLLGQDTPIGASSLTIGIPATLPTGGYAKLNGGVTARTFQTSTSIARLSPGALAALAPQTITLADHEGFPAHANSIRLRGLG